jgi:hypothetical protein
VIDPIASVERTAASDGLRRAHDAVEATRIARSARESELASARIEHEWRARSVRSREHELAGLEARLKSLEELEAARAGYGDAARAVLAQANGKVNQRGAIADHLEVSRLRARGEAYLGDALGTPSSNVRSTRSRSGRPRRRRWPLGLPRRRGESRIPNPESSQRPTSGALA